VQRSLNEWNDEETKKYNEQQWRNPYRSTVAFAEFIRPMMENTETVADLGAGGGAPTAYMQKKFPNSQFFAFDIKPQKNVEYIDMFNLPDDIDFMGYEAVISLQTLSWLPEYETPLSQIATKIRPKWMAFSSLFYEGEISCRIEVNERLRPRESYYNIYSIPQVSTFLGHLGYKPRKMQRFDIDISMPKPANNNIMKSYTFHGHVYSGPLYLPWWFLAYEKI